jgi:hypothetical protein
VLVNFRERQFRRQASGDGPQVRPAPREAARMVHRFARSPQELQL